jgi:hypothetical protein
MFDIRGTVQLGGKSPASKKFPAEVKGIKVQQKCQRIYFLHSAGWGTPVDEGKQIGTYTVEFADHQTRLQIPIIYGRDVRNWHFQAGEAKPSTGLNTVWTGENEVSKKGGRSLRLFMTTWTNLIPDVAIETIDFTSSMASPAPFLIAITVE